MARRIVSPQASKHLQKTTIGEGQKTVTETDSPEHQRAIKRTEQRQTLVSFSDRLAEDTLYFRNYKWDMFDRNYPNLEDALMRIVTKYYPYAKGGPMFIDEPATEHWHKRCLEKQKIMKQKGYRHIVIGPTDQFNDLLFQLAECEKKEVS